MSQRHSYKLWLRDAQGIWYIMDFTHLPGAFASSASAPSMAGDESPPPHDNQWSRGPCSCPGKTETRQQFFGKIASPKDLPPSIIWQWKNSCFDASLHHRWSGSIDPSFSGTRWNPSLQTWLHLFGHVAASFQSQLEQPVVPNLHRTKSSLHFCIHVFLFQKSRFQSISSGESLSVTPRSSQEPSAPGINDILMICPTSLQGESVYEVMLMIRK